jgi:hypothetical protein
MKVKEKNVIWFEAIVIVNKLETN